MRLSASEVEVMREVFRKTFGHGSLYLFGSRTDDTKRGGDIDLYVKPIFEKVRKSKLII